MTVLKCVQCGSVLSSLDKGARWRKYCSDKCRKRTVCLTCRKRFAPDKSGRLYCSNTCRGVGYSLTRNRNKGLAVYKLCKGCGRGFSITGDKPNFKRLSLVQVYCSRSCRLSSRDSKKALCPLCGIEYKPRSYKTKFCSSICSYASRRTGKKMYSFTCKTCGVVYTTDDRRSNGYCSSKCWYVTLIQPIGTSVLRKYRGRTEWFVKVDNKPRYAHQSGGTVKRKATVVVENALGRKLKRQEAASIQFLDGDYLNCKLSNLFLPSLGHSRVCVDCGDIKTGKRGVIFNSRDGEILRCKRCYTARRRLGLHSSRILEEKQVRLIRQLLRCQPRRCKGYQRGWHPNRLSCRVVSGWFLVSANVIHSIRRGKTWKGVRPMAKTEVWKALLSQHDKLKKQASGTLFDRVSILAKVYEDPHYATDMQKSGKSHIEELDKRVSDTCANFTELFQMLRLFPLKRQWTGGDLNAMRLKMLEKLREGNGKKKPSSKKTGTRKTATLTEVRELEAEVKRLRAEIKSANQIIKSLENQLEVARETIGSLNETISLFKVSKKSAQAARKVAAK